MISDFKNKLNAVFSSKTDITCYDQDFVQTDILGLCESLKTKITELETRVAILENENVELTNELYRLENSLEERINILGAETLFPRYPDETP